MLTRLAFQRTLCLSKPGEPINDKEPLLYRVTYLNRVFSDMLLSLPSSGFCSRYENRTRVTRMKT